MNKNPKRDANMDEVISNLLNPKPKKKTQNEKYWDVQKDVLKNIFN